MRSFPPPARPGLVAATLLLFALPAAARGQALDRDARIPASGELWLEVAPSNERWHEQFALDSELTDDGGREPLSADYDGPIAGRLFPGLDPLLADLNRDAVALGWDSLAATDARLGSLAIGSIDRELRRVPFGLSFGVLGRVAIDVSVPLVRGTASTAFAFDSTTADWITASRAIPQPDAFFGSFGSARAGLASLIEGGSLTPEEEVAARALLDRSEAFATALERRVDEEALLPVGASAPGTGLLSTYEDLSSAYVGYGLSLPALALPDSATSGDVQPLLAASPLGLDSLRTEVRGWSIGEVEVGVRVKLIDTFEPVPSVDEARFRRTREPDLRGDGVRFRTTVGGRLRLPVSEPDAAPYLVPSSPLQQPIGDGQTDVELGVWQDLQVGRLFWLVGSLRVVWQLEDELTLRVAGPGEPFAYETQERTVTRDLGDRLALRLSPRLRINESISLGLEYLWDRKGEDVYSGDGVPDPAPLSRETEIRRHRLGIGAWYRTTPRFAAGLSRIPIELAFVWQTSVAGSGGSTPASGIVTTSVRVPLRLF